MNAALEELIRVLAEAAVDEYLGTLEPQIGSASNKGQEEAARLPIPVDVHRPLRQRNRALSLIRT